MRNRLRARALLWLAFLAPLFFLTYNWSNQVASGRTNVPVLLLPWDASVPFLAWTILPYWSLDLLYAASFLLCRTRAEMDTHGKRLLAVQLISTACFLALPLRCSYERPLLTGWAAAMFDALNSFDKPFNQAPSLHASIAVILWTRYREHTRSLMRVVMALWLAVSTLSTLTTWQRHSIDILTGLWVGLLVVAAVPLRRAAEPQVRLTLYYFGGAAFCTAAAFVLRGPAWVMLWPGFSLSLVAAAYWTGDPVWMGKRNGRPGFWMLPYTAGAWVNSRLWTRAEQPKNHLADQVWIGRAPSRRDLSGIRSVVDLTAELSIRSDAQVPMLDLSPPSEDQIDRAVSAILSFAGARPTLVCCALGYSRSAVASAAWLIAAGHANDAEDALAHVRRARPQIVVGSQVRKRLEQWAERRQGRASRSNHSKKNGGLARSLFYRAVRLVTRTQVKGLRAFRTEGQQIYVANHRSHLDALLIASALPDASRCETRPVAAEEYWARDPLRRYLMRKVFRAVLVRRNGFQLNPLEDVAAALAQGDSLIFFPEGTRGPGGGLRALKPGIFCLARRYPEVDIVPVWVGNSAAALPKGCVIPRPVRCSVTFGAPMRWQPGQPQTEFLSDLHNAIEALRPSCDVDRIP